MKILKLTESLRFVNSINENFKMKVHFISLILNNFQFKIL